MSSSGSPSSSGGGGGGGPCGACKFLRRKCVAGCIFAPYFDSEQGAAHFAAVHKVFGASNVSKVLHHVPEHKRADAVVSMCFEAQARLRDPIYGCVSHIVSLQQQVVSLQTELSYVQAHLATLELPQPPPAAPVTSSGSPPPLSISDLPTLTPSMYDLSPIFEPMSSTWAMQQQPRPSSDHLFGVPSSSSIGGGGELQALAREFLHGGQMPAHQPPRGTGGSARTVIKRE